MKPIQHLLAGLALLASQSASATAIELFEYAFHIDGAVSNPVFSGDPVPTAVNLAGFDTATGLGNITLTLSGAGNHTAGVFLNHDIDTPTNTYFNEEGTAVGAPAAGQSWEIDEPGYSFGDIYDHFLAGGLDNTSVAGPEDISMAMLWDFVLQPNETGVLNLLVSTMAPTSVFYLRQTDPDSQADLYLSAQLTISPTQAIPEPATLALLGLGLLGLWQAGRTGHKVIGKAHGG